MIRISVLYPKGAGTHFDHDYYVTKHVPLVRQLCGDMGLGRIEVIKGTTGMPQGEPGFTCIATYDFDSPERAALALGKHSAQIFSDIPNFTDIQPRIQFNKILEV
jgi:uncharacterized protein (TIGR02118 family)